MTLYVLDVEDWDLVFRFQPPPGTVFNPAGCTYSVTFRAGNGGPPVGAASCTDGGLVITGGPEPLIQVHIPVAPRIWRASGETPVFGDVMRCIGPDALITKWLTRLEFTVLPGSASTGIAQRGNRVVLRSALPDDLDAQGRGIGPQGPPGRDATALPVASVPAAEPIKAGQPLTLDRTTGRAHLATAAIYARAFVVGFAAIDADTGDRVTIMGRLLTLSDWTASAGAADLPIGANLFLGPTPGTVGPTPPTGSGMTVAGVGFAAGPRTLAISMPNPILL